MIDASDASQSGPRRLAGDFPHSTFRRRVESDRALIR